MGTENYYILKYDFRNRKLYSLKNIYIAVKNHTYID